MEKNKLPIEELQKYGIMNDDRSFSKKLTEADIEKFLKGHIIIADYKKDRITFQLTDNNSRLQVQKFQRDKEVEQILEDSKEKIQYSKMKNLNQDDEYNVKVFISNKDKTETKEYDLFRDIKELTLIVLATKELVEINKYKLELEKLKGFMQDKIDKFPELNKQLTEDINIVSNEISVISTTNIELKTNNQANTNIDFDVNDPDRYQEANQNREQDAEIEQEVRRGRRR